MTHVEALRIALNLLYAEERRLAPMAIYGSDDAAVKDRALYEQYGAAAKVLEQLARIPNPFQVLML